MLVIQNNAFENSAMSTVVIPQSITKIKTSAFASCLNLESVKYPANGIESATDIFYGCSKLKTITITGTGNMQDYEENSQPWLSLRTILTTVVFESGVTSVGNYGFEKITTLSSITWNDIQTIGTNSFQGCTGLGSIDFSSTSVKTINSYAFSGVVE